MFWIENCGLQFFLPIFPSPACSLFYREMAWPSGHRAGSCWQKLSGRHDVSVERLHWCYRKVAFVEWTHGHLDAQFAVVAVVAVAAAVDVSAVVVAVKPRDRRWGQWSAWINCGGLVSLLPARGEAWKFKMGQRDAPQKKCFAFPNLMYSRIEVPSKNKIFAAQHCIKDKASFFSDNIRQSQVRLST